MAVKSLRERQAEATRQLLVSVARELFAEHGYAATSIDDIIQQAGVARGALYHHFPGKEALFRAVYDAVQADIATRVVATALAAEEPWAGVRAGLGAFLDACLEPEFRTIVVLDSVPVLAKDMWRAASSTSSTPSYPCCARSSRRWSRPSFPGVAIDALAHIALGGLYGASLYIARASDPKAARADAGAVLDTLIGGLRVRIEPSV